MDLSDTKDTGARLFHGRHLETALPPLYPECIKLKIGRMAKYKQRVLTKHIHGTGNKNDRDRIDKVSILPQDCV